MFRVSAFLIFQLLILSTFSLCDETLLLCNLLWNNALYCIISLFRLLWFSFKVSLFLNLAWCSWYNLSAILICLSWRITYNSFGIHNFFIFFKPPSIRKKSDRCGKMYPVHTTQGIRKYLATLSRRRGPAAIPSLTLLSGYIITLMKTQSFSIYDIKQSIKVSETSKFSTILLTYVI